MWTPKVISLIQMMFPAVITLLTLVPFSARHLQYEILYLLIAFVVLTTPGFPIIHQCLQPQSVLVENPRELRLMDLLWGAETQQSMRRLYVLQSHHRTQSWLLWIWLGMQMNSSHENGLCRVPGWSVLSPPMAHLHCSVRKHSLLPAEGSDPRPLCDTLVCLCKKERIN